MLQVYNTLTKQKEEFKPINKNKVNMYVCGVTVYDYCHLGHARALVVFDIIYRYLVYKKYDVTFIRNFTDIDDKIINRSNEKSIPWQQLTEKFIQAFHEDTQALGLKPATQEPKATEHINEIIDLIKSLEEQGVAYQAGNDVFFSVRKFEGYGKLSGKNIDDLESGARVDVMDVKKDPLDFALWKGSKPGEPAWDSPWGAGRPGWHIECSAMSMKYLSQSFDIHGGGRDLIFPHHENEIAQSEACTHKPFAKYWLHNGFVNINKEKMSKSLNNFLTIRDILKSFPGEVIRLFILSAHYRSQLDYTDQNIQNAFSGLKRFYQTKKRLEDFCASNQDEGDCPVDFSDKIKELKNDFVAAMDDDFNSAKVVGSLFEWVRIWNKTLDENQVPSKKCVQAFLDFVNQDVADALGVFGLPADEFLDLINQQGLSEANISEQDIQNLIEERKQAKQNKNYQRADEIRDLLKEKGIQLKDSPDGTTTWERG